MPCAFFVSRFTQSPLAAVASPASARPWPPRNPFALADTVAPLPLRMFATAIASTPPAVNPLRVAGQGGAVPVEDVRDVDREPPARRAVPRERCERAAERRRGVLRDADHLEVRVAAGRV